MPLVNTDLWGTQSIAPDFGFPSSLAREAREVFRPMSPGVQGHCWGSLLCRRLAASVVLRGHCSHWDRHGCVPKEAAVLHRVTRLKNQD